MLSRLQWSLVVVNEKAEVETPTVMSVRYNKHKIKAQIRDFARKGDEYMSPHAIKLFVKQLKQVK